MAANVAKLPELWRSPDRKVSLAKDGKASF
jgi:hypothetical protein